MTGLIILAVIATYLTLGARHVMPFAKDYMRNQRETYPLLYTGRYASRYWVNALPGEAIWVGIGKALFWPYVFMARWITSHLVNSLTAEERKAAELKEARRIIAEYEAEQFAKAAR